VIESGSEIETWEFARRLAETLPPPRQFLLCGELGAGKTHFAKGLASGYGIEDDDDVTSPTFTLVNRYTGRVPVYHVDLYRIESGDFTGLGLEEIFDDTGAVAIIEWAERLGDLAPPDAVRIDLTYVDATTRRIEVHDSGSVDSPDR
jgi:tRNA threonylcarbamoyladenosine biosynthesis protein TsaE